MALTGEARKKRPGHELPRSGSKKKKKIAAVHEAPAENAVEAVLASESDKTKCLSGSAKRKLKKQQPKKEDSNGTAAEKEQEAPIEQDKIVLSYTFLTFSCFSSFLLLRYFGAGDDP